MANELSTLSPIPGSTKSRMRVGRGEGSGKGKTAGRGTKGQGARGGVRRGFEGGQMPLHRRLPKVGFKNPFSVTYTEVSIGAIAGAFGPGEVVTVEELRARGLVKALENGGVKVLGGGELAHALVLRGLQASKAVAELVSAAGGSVEAV
ncbi:MAG: 50S ribosomal protein L15 [Deltaproteobacteria bacterium]|jgi:large subunit ribosomal protein L15|nr:50S ribosomal protein L15 [Deltaproteobacteria bacterium]